MAFLRKRILLVTSLLLTVMMLIGVGMVSHDALTIRAAEEIEEDTSKVLLDAEQWMNHQEEIEVAFRNFVVFGRQQGLDMVAENRQASVEHIQAMKEILSEYQDDAEDQIQGLLKFTERHQRVLDRIIASKKAGDASGVERALASKEVDLFMYGAKLIIENLTQTLQEKRSRYNNEVSLNVLRGSISFALLALFMISTVWISYFVTNRAQRKNEELTALLGFEATHDALTGLPNRRYIYDRLGHDIDLANRHKLRLALMVVDLDGFKAVNDTYGHNAGDAVLKEVASRFKWASRTSDFVARTGGDEFVLVAENIDQVSSLEHLAQRLVECLAEPIEIGDQSRVAVGCSIGIATYPDHSDNLDELLAAADRAMYAAKAGGKNSWRVAGERKA
jgi:diguanylate cyclase (GGDEF)-like protein